MASELDSRLAEVEEEVELLKELQQTLLDIRERVLELTTAAGARGAGGQAGRSSGHGGGR